MISILVINLSLLSLFLPVAQIPLALVALPGLFVLFTRRPLLTYPMVTLAAGLSLFIVQPLAGMWWLIAISRCPWRSRDAANA